jgi:hypothetical protein
MPGTTPRVVLLVACLGVGLACVFVGDWRVERRSPASVESAAVPSPAPEPTSRHAVRPAPIRVRFPADIEEVGSPLEEQLERQWPERRRSDPRANPPVLGAITLAMREYVDMSGHVSPTAARVNGLLWLAEKGRAYIRIWMDPLLEGGGPVDGTVRDAQGTWKRDGDHLVVEGLEVVIGKKPVFGPAGTTHRWRLEGDLALVHAAPFTFERAASR